jgi:LysM repeat protein
MQNQVLVRQLLAAISLLLAACGAQSAADATPSATAALIAYSTVTPTATIASDDDCEINIEQPSPTPFSYTVVAGDTFFTIAARQGISLDALLAANPGVDPRVLAPGTLLIIPVDGSSTPVASLPTPTAVPLSVTSPYCYSSAAGELWCFLLLENRNDAALENISGVVQLLDEEGEVVTNIEAVAPLNVLAAGERMPLVAFLSEPPAEWASAQGQLFSAYFLGTGAESYLPATIADLQLSADEGRYRVQGSVELNGEASSVWVLAIAYDAEEQPVGVRRWESDGDLDFDFWVYSLGPEISEVEVLVEARP